MERSSASALLMSAIRNTEPVGALRVVAQGLLIENHDREAVIEEFNCLVEVLRQSDDEASESAVLEVLDALRRWGPPGSAI